MITTSLKQDIPVSEAPSHKAPGVPHDAGPGKSGDLTEGNGHRVLDPVGKVTETRPQNNGGIGNERKSPANERCGCLNIGRCAHRIIPATVAVMKAAMVPPIMALSPKRDRSWRRDGAIPPMPPSWMAMDEKLAKPQSA